MVSTHLPPALLNLTGTPVGTWDVTSGTLPMATVMSMTIMLGRIMRL